MGQAGDDAEDRGRSVKVNLRIITSAVLTTAETVSPFLEFEFVGTTACNDALKHRNL